jgi:outer membrane scaffolding protein for murein synthesis (MipA/OmpV family)
LRPTDRHPGAIAIERNEMKKMLLLSTLLNATAAHAQDSTFTVGAGIAAGTRYSGSDEHLVAPVIVADYQAANGFYASTLRGIGFAAGGDRLSASIGLGYRGERRENDTNGFVGRSGSKALKGMGDVKGSATLNVGAEAQLTDVFSVGAHAELPVSRRENGKQFSLGLNAKLLESQADKVAVGVALQFGEAKYMQTYYGVDARQAARSGYRVFKPGGGLYGTDVSVSWEHRIDAHWTVTSMLGAQRLTGDAAKSPLVRRKTAPTFAVYAGYQF